MSKVCVFITGTNATGKTTLAKSIIARFGGIKEATRELTFCNDARVCFAGKYTEQGRFGGVDGFNKTSTLADVVEKGLKVCDIVICEGMYMHSFGLNLTNAMFKAEKHLVVFLYADGNTLASRINERSGNTIGKAVLPKQRNCSSSAKKWQSIGVPVMPFNTAENTLEEETELIYEKIIQLWSGEQFMTKK